MNYYYDFIINLDTNYHYFFELEENNINIVKKMPIIRISSESYITLLSSLFKVDNIFLNNIKDKSKLKNNDNILYMCILSDTKNSFVVEFSNTGECINKSSLLLEDELNICELSYSLDITNINYNIIKNDYNYIDTIQNIKIKKLISTEIDTCLNNKDYNKLKFIYLEWFNEINTNIEDMVNKMKYKLKSNITDKEYNIYKLIKLSYNNV